VPRDATALENLDRAADYIATQLHDAGIGDVSAQAFDDKRYRNIVGVIRGSGQGVVVVGAHYDACGPLPGADDNASGVAVLIETARLLAHSSPGATIELVAYPNEEPPFFRTPMMGSYVHAGSLIRDNVRAMVSLEMLGYYSDAQDSQHYPLGAMKLLYPRRGDFVAVIGDMGMTALVRRFKSAMQPHTSVPVWSMNAPRFVEGIDYSDHQSYRALDMPAIMVTDTAFFRNLAYHTAEDTPGRLDYARMAEVAAGVASALSDIAR
jgi:Zn-dependent M28 family amino/carboxypeptidase